MTFKIKLEDKAAFLNRMEKQGEAIGSEQIQDDKLKGIFEVTIDDPKQLEIAKAILKQSPKINTLSEMEKKKLTKSELAEMVRQELQGVLNEKKKMKDDKKKEMMNEDLGQLLNMSDHELGVFLSGVATILGVGGLLVKAAVADFKQRKQDGEIKSKEDIADVVKDNAGQGQMNENQLNESVLLAGLATLLGVGGTLVAALVKDLKNAKTKEEKADVLRRAAGGIEKSMGASDDPSKNF
jgi:hypothetical protein